MKLKEIRESLGYTRKQACDYIGCSRTVYTRYERGTRLPSLPMLIRIADVFGVSIDYLVGREKFHESALTNKENEFLALFRNADPRAQDDAMDIMQRHSLGEEL